MLSSNLSVVLQPSARALFVCMDSMADDKTHRKSQKLLLAADVRIGRVQGGAVTVMDGMYVQQHTG